MSEVILADYIGNCDERGKPIGHPLKILKEYNELISDALDVQLIIPQNMLEYFSTQKAKGLKYYINQNPKNKVEKARNVCKRLCNIFNIFKTGRGKNIWFCNVDFYLFFYLWLFRKRSAKTICTLYRQDFSGDGSLKKVKDFIFRQALKKVDLIICTNRHLVFDKQKCFYMPDYFYLPEKYDKYLVGKKENKVVCLGTMGSNKQLRETVEQFLKIEMPLEICGKFANIKEFEELSEFSNSHIKITNRYLSETEYLEKLGQAKYCILPYNMDLYHERTSGVILESIFLRTIPITHQELLEYNQIMGIGYNRIEDISDETFEKEQENIDIGQYDQLIREVYNKDLIKEELTKQLL